MPILKKDDHTDVLHIYAKGIFGDTCSVCTALPKTEMLCRLGSRLGGRWRVSSSSFPGGENNPCACERSPKTSNQLHYMCEQVG